MSTLETGPALSAELRAILVEADVLRLRLQTEVLPELEWAEHALARIETAARRVLHLVGA